MSPAHARPRSSPPPRPASVLAALHELESRQEALAWGAADELADALLERWGDVPAVLVEVARLRARQGRRAEAMALLGSEHVGPNVRLLNTPLCARLGE